MVVEGEVVVVEGVLVVEGVVGVESDAGLVDGAGAAAAPTVTANFIPLPQWPTTPQI